MRINRQKLNESVGQYAEEEKARLNKLEADLPLHVASAAIANKIKRRLRILGMSQTELANRLKTSPANVSRYLSGKTNFELRTLIEIEEAIDVHIIDRDVIPENEFLPKRAMQMVKLHIAPDSYVAVPTLPPVHTPKIYRSRTTASVKQPRNKLNYFYVAFDDSGSYETQYAPIKQEIYG